MSAPLLPCVEVEPARAARCSVIWLHGLGADGHDFEPVLPHLGVPSELSVRFVFPHAPSIPVTINGGFVMPAWYDIREADLQRRHDEVGIRRSQASVQALIERENERGVPCERLVVAGFSQGGAIALHTALLYSEPLAGVLALSTYLVLGETLERERSSANQRTPIFQAHGLYDPMVPFERGRASHGKLSELGYSVEWHAYPMQHEVMLEELRDIGAWITRVLSGR